MRQSEVFSIRQMIELTGLSEFTIRGWENRYSAFSPRRSDTGRREYSKNDIERALLLRELLKRGYKVSQIAKLKNQKLLQLLESATGEQSGQNEIENSSLIRDALAFMSLQNWTELSSLLKQVSSKNTKELILHFFLPLLSELATRSKRGQVSIAQEHIFSSLLKEKLYSALSGLGQQKKTTEQSEKNRFVLATPEGDFHEMGLLMAHVLLRSYGMTSLYLGPHTPAQDLAETALRFKATHLIIVSTVSKKQGARHELLTFVSAIQKKVGFNLKVILAGGQVPLISQDQKTKLLNFSNFQDFDDYLNDLKAKH